MTPNRFEHPPPADDKTFDKAWASAERALRAQDHDTDLPEGDDLPEAPEGHQAIGLRKRARA